MFSSIDCWHDYFDWEPQFHIVRLYNPEKIKVDHGWIYNGCSMNGAFYFLIGVN